MFLLNKEDMQKIAPLFDGWEETLIWSCLQGYMGNAWVDDHKTPKSAQIIIADFCFFAGKPNAVLVKNIPASYPSQLILMIPQNQDWERLIEKAYSGKYQRTMRYATKKEPDVFDKEKLLSYINKLPKEYILSRIDEKLYHQVKLEEWSKDLCSQFPAYEDYKSRGLGFVILHEGKVVSGASSYTVFDQGIEIEIDTKEEYQRRGLALVCASRLILECLDRGLYPSWDAANKKSLDLAEKLGYHFDKEYVTYMITNFR